MFRLLFYPGVIIHEISHIIGCIILNVRISKISFGLQESYVKHEQAGPVRMSLIALAPFYLGAAVGVLLFMLANKTYYSELLWFILLNYLGICILYNSIPSAQDTKNINNSIKLEIKKEWKKTFGNKLFGIIKTIIFYLPIFLVALFVSVFDKFDILRAFYVLFIFMLVYGLI